MLLQVRHVTRYDYDPPAHRASLRLKLYPPRFEAQAPGEWRVSVNGEEIRPMLINALGEGEAVWAGDEELARIEIVAEGAVQTDDVAGVVRGLADQTRPALFLRRTPLTEPDAAIHALGQSVRVEPDALARLHRLNAAVRDAVDYVAGATTHETTAADALKLGKGVCQDHAHVFIAAARSIGVPARYVTGYLSPDFDGLHETHACAEAFAPDLGWVGFDPSNRQCPTAGYIRLCACFDAADAAPVRGAVAAGAGEGLTVAVEVAQAQQ